MDILDQVKLVTEAVEAYRQRYGSLPAAVAITPALKFGARQGLQVYPEMRWLVVDAYDVVLLGAGSTAFCSLGSSSHYRLLDMGFSSVTASHLDVSEHEAIAALAATRGSSCAEYQLAALRTAGFDVVKK